MNERWNDLFEELKTFSNSDNCPKDIPSPNSISLKYGYSVLKEFKKYNMWPIDVNCHPDGGIMIEYSINELRFVFSLHNDSEIIYLNDEADRVQAKEVTIKNIPSIILGIHEHQENYGKYLVGFKSSGHIGYYWGTPEEAIEQCMIEIKMSGYKPEKEQFERLVILEESINKDMEN